MASFKDRLNEALSIRGMKASELSKLSGISEGSISQYRKGHFKASQVNLELLAKALNVQIAWLMGAEIPMNKEYTADSNIFNHPDIMPVKKKRFPYLGEVACGEPIYADEEHDVYLESDGSIKADFCLRCKGDSMTGDNINDGDVVFIRSQASVNNGEIACVIIDDEATLKHVYLSDKSVTLVSSNLNYPPMIYGEHDAGTIKILGKAVALSRIL